MRRRSLRAPVATAVAVSLLAGGCSAPKDRITVLAAASLTEVFTELAELYTQQTGVEVRLAFDSSATLARQVAEGAPADVLATADLPPMQQSLEDRTVQRPVAFATNQAALVVPAGNPAAITELKDMNGADYVVCVPTAPCGQLAREVLAQAPQIERPPVSQEVDVKAVLAKVTSGEADAGIVYATDVVAAGDTVRQIDLPASVKVAPQIAVVRDTDRYQAAKDFIDLLGSSVGQRLLAEAGFGPP